MKPLGKAYKDAEANMGGGFQKLPAGGYVCIITEIEDKQKEERLEIIYDVAEGPYKGYYSDDFGKKNPFTHKFIKSYKETALGFFKGFLTAIDKSNGTDFSTKAEGGLQEQQLVGKLVGLVIGYEEYDTRDDGNFKQRSYVSEVRSIETIRSGDFKVPELRKTKELEGKLKSAPVDGFSPLTDDDIPF